MATINTRVDEGVGVIELSRPDRLNALNAEMVQALSDALAAFAEAEEVRSVLITGSGAGFCAGIDVSLLTQVGPEGAFADLGELVEATFYPVVRTIARFPKPTVAYVNGAAAGAGMSLSLCCDFRFAAAGASFTSAFTKLGLVPDSGATFFLPRVVGPARALEIATFNERIDAQRALALGLVNWVATDEEDGLTAAMARARAAAKVPPAAIAATRALILDPEGAGLDAVMEGEKRALVELGKSDAHRQAVRAFLSRG